MKYTFVAILIAIAFEVIEYNYGHEITDLLQKDGILLDLIVAAPFLILGLSIDFLVSFISKKEKEKKAIFNATLHGVNHHLRNLLNNMQLIKYSEKIKDELGHDIVDLMQKTEDETVIALEALANLSEISAESIKEISEKNISGNTKRKK